MLRGPEWTGICFVLHALHRGRECKLEVDVDSLLQATLPPGPVEDEVDTYEALALAGRVSELSNKATPEHSDFVLS